MTTRTPLFAANWKMNRLVRDNQEYVAGLKRLLVAVPSEIAKQYQVVLAPQATHLASLVKACEGTGFEVSAQNCGPTVSGAYTGEISPAVLKELHCGWVILGHSERRHLYKEDDQLIAARLQAALAEGLKVMLCVGEKLDERKSGKTNQVVETQLSILRQNFPASAWGSLVVAYEPVWAIGTGENASPAQAQEVHAFVRGWVTANASAETAQALRVLYGGSVKPENAAALMSQKDVDGFLVGGASLDATTFANVILHGLKSRV